MPLHHHIDQDPPTLIVHLSGKVSVEETIDFVERLIGEPLIKPGTSCLFDLRSVSNLEHHGEQVRTLAELVARGDDHLFAGTRWALLVEHGSAIYGVARMFQIFREDAPYELEIFESEPEARRWLVEDAGVGRPGHRER